MPSTIGPDPRRGIRPTACVEDHQLADESGERRQTDNRDRAKQEQPAQQIRVRDFSGRCEPIQHAPAPLGDQIDKQEQRRARQGAVQKIVERGRDPGRTGEADRDQQHAHRPDDRKGNKVEQRPARQNPDRSEHNRGERSRQYPRFDNAGERAGGSAEHGAVDAQYRVDADLRHDHEQRRGRSRRGGIGRRQPPVQRHERRLDRENQKQQQHAGAQQRRIRRDRPAAP